MKKIQQFILLFTCLAVIVVGAMQRDGKVWGYRLTSTIDSATASTPFDQDMRTLPDGTFVINTTRLGENVNGYAGQVPLEIHIKNGKIIHIDALDNNETPGFFNRARALLSQWDGLDIQDAENKQVDAVSGATYSSKAIIKNVRLGLRHALATSSQLPSDKQPSIDIKTAIAIIVVLMAAIIPLFLHNKHYHLAQLALNVLVLGFWCGTFLDWTVLIGYASGGIHTWSMIVPIVMLITAFVYPLFGKKNYYCTHVCPYGSLQDLAGKTNHHKWKLGKKTILTLTYFRQVLFAVLMVLMLTGITFSWMDYEVFSAFIFTSASVIVIILAVIFLLLAVFIPRPYCRFVCPTGTLFKLSEGNR